MRTETYITGYLVGHIWWPQAECFKSFQYNLTREAGRYTSTASLRDHLLAITRDGDFQSCAIAQGEIVIRRTRADPTKPGHTIRVTRILPLEDCANVADLLHDNPDWAPSFDEDDA